MNTTTGVATEIITRWKRDIGKTVKYEQMIADIDVALQHREQEVRERRAQIAETIPDTIFDTDHEPALTEQQIRNGIAAAIRRDDTPQEGEG